MLNLYSVMKNRAEVFNQLNRQILLGIGLLVFALVFLLGCGSKEAPGAIYGTVMLQGQDDYSGVMVMVDGTELFTETTESGGFIIFDVPQGNYTVTASKDGFMGQSKNGIVILAEQAVMDVDFELICLTPPGLPE